MSDIGAKIADFFENGYFRSPSPLTHEEIQSGQITHNAGCMFMFNLNEAKAKGSFTHVLPIANTHDIETPFLNLLCGSTFLYQSHSRTINQCENMIAFIEQLQDCFKRDTGYTIKPLDTIAEGLLGIQNDAMLAQRIAIEGPEEVAKSIPK